MFSLLHHSLFAKTSPLAFKSRNEKLCNKHSLGSFFLQKLFFYREVISGFGGKFAVKNGENVYKRHLTILFCRWRLLLIPLPPPKMEADEDGRGLHLQPPAASPTSDALSTSGDSNISLLQSLSVNDNGDPGSPAAANLDEIDHQLGINFHHLLDIPFHQVPQSDHLPHHHDDNQTTPSTLQHQIDLNLDALLSNAGTFFFRHSGHN